MGLFDMFDPLKSTANWGAKAFFSVTKGDYELASHSLNEVMLQMLSFRPGTPKMVRTKVLECRISSLSELCLDIIVSEAKSVNPNDIPSLKSDIEKILSKRGVPEEFI